MCVRIFLLFFILSFLDVASAAFFVVEFCAFYFQLYFFRCCIGVFAMRTCLFRSLSCPFLRVFLFPLHFNVHFYCIFLHQFIQLFFCSFSTILSFWSVFFLHFGLSSCCVVFYSAFWLHTFNARTVVHWMIFGWLWWLLVHTRTYTHNENQHQPSTIYKYSFNSFLATANQ